MRCPVGAGHDEQSGSVLFYLFKFENRNTYRFGPRKKSEQQPERLLNTCTAAYSPENILSVIILLNIFIKNAPNRLLLNL
jgi:hypothetical protein